MNDLGLSVGHRAPGAATQATGIRVVSLPGRRFPHNPYLRLFSDAFSGTPVTIVDLRSWRALLFRFDIIHVHFPEHYVSAQTLPRACLWVGVYAAYFLLAKLLGRRIVWTVHNVLPAQNRHPWLLGPWMRLFRRLADALVFLSRSSRADFLERFPRHAGKPACVTAHGVYPVPPPDRHQQAMWRARFAQDGSTFLVGFLGSIKQYKNIRALRALPAQLSDGRRVHVVVAGTPDAPSRADLAEVARDLGDRVTIMDGPIGDGDLNQLIQAMDVVFLPYLRGWNSGFAMLVLGNRTRLLTSALPMFWDLRDEVGHPWLSIYASTRDITHALDAIAQNPDEADTDRRLDRFLRANTFERGANDLARFYGAVLKG